MAIIGEYDPKKDLGSTVRFQASILEKTDAFVRHIDAQVNILVGLSSAIFLLSVREVDLSDLSSLTLVIFSGLAVIIALFAVHPPKFMRKQHQSESLFYNKKITSFPNAQDYADAVNKLVGDSDAIVREYSGEIYNSYKYYYRPKRKLFVWSRNSLLLGVILSYLLLFLGF